MYFKNEISNHIHHKCGLCNSFKKSDFLVYFQTQDVDIKKF